MDFMALGTVLVVLGSVLYTGFTGHARFAYNACPRLQPYLTEHIVGQDLALRQLVHAICDHLEQHEKPQHQNPVHRPDKPLVVSVHGPPGVGKSLTHYLLARVLYNRLPEGVTDCPGIQCPGYKVMYGMDYVQQDRQQQHHLLSQAILGHLQHTPESLLVVEEYDKLDCASRGLFRQLLDSPQSANLTWGKSIVVLESNSGYTLLHDMLENAGGNRDKILAEDATRALKDLIYDKWTQSGCESKDDSAKMLALVNHYLPFFPLDASHIEDLITRDLHRRHLQQSKEQNLGLMWDPGLPEYLAGRLDYDGKYPVEGAKEVKTIMTRYVSAAVRQWNVMHSKDRQEQIHQDRHTHVLHLSLPLGEQNELQVSLQPV